ncbi:LPXTG cell wall anchor domain-containing protein [Candidatus Enterococcus leclercqii]|uniref:LPXTG cell wall anchor domain-containing protein n=1 Tax=Candidatus Enterococcus leclercqii TaxID=1857218 RepID=UPI00137B1852|nr:LPXTG cell wall anchor domain-containing protein [Enterococcus sp. CU9D]KAF1293712.1 hypothetical protein BAU14_13940 [Enterococcus sp. CU9D]
MKKYLFLALAAVSLSIAPAATWAAVDEHEADVDFELVDATEESESTETTDTESSSDTEESAESSQSEASSTESTEEVDDSTDEANVRPVLPGTGSDNGSGTGTKPSMTLPATGELVSFSAAMAGTVMVGLALLLLVSRKKGAGKE